MDIVSESNIYSPLSTERVEIRLLSLHPGSGQNVIQGSLQHVFLDDVDRPTYETISYCWGDASNRAAIVIDGYDLDVAASTAAALRCMRLEAQERMLWIDGVCINQGNKDERSRQVPLMTEIYSSSVGNLIHLADHAPLAARALASIRRILGVAQIELDKVDQLNLPVVDISPSQCALQELMTLDSAAVTDLYGQPLFRRQWIFQELVMAPGNTIYYGGFKMNFEPISTVASWIVGHRISVDIMHKISVKITISEARGLWEWLELTRHGRQIEVDLWSLLEFTELCETTILHDKVYSVLGLYRRMLRLPGLPNMLQPDYNKPVRDVLRDATRFILIESKSLEFLQDNVPRSQQLMVPSLPSWVSRWFVKYKPDLHPQRLSSYFQASGSSEVHVEDIQSGAGTDSLLMAGISLSIITRVSTTLTSDILSDPAILTNWIVSFNSEIVTSIEDSPLNVGITLITGRITIRRKATKEDADGFQALVRHLNTERTVPSHLSSALGTLSQSSCEQPCAACFCDQMGNMARNRRVFLTSSGSLGLGNEDVQPGDELVILQGGPRPFILRAIGDDYQLICECYVHGIMDEEAWKGEDDERIRKFNII